MATSGSCSLTLRSAEHPVTPLFPGQLQIRGRKIHQKKTGEFQEAALIQRIVQQTHRNRIPPSAIKERRICKRFVVEALVSSRPQHAGIQLQLPTQGCSVASSLEEHENASQPFCKKPCLILGKKRAKKHFLGSPQEEHVVHKASSLFCVIEG